MTSLNIVFGGTPEFALPALEALLAAGHRIAAVYTQPDRPAGRGQRVVGSAVKECALRNRIPVEQPPTLRDATAIARLENYRPDAMVVVAYGLLLPEAVLAIPRFGCINIHGSILPRWRGAAPIQRALLARDRTTGISIMCMAAGLDTGPVLSMHEITIEPRETGASLHDRLATLGALALPPTLEKFVAGALQPQPQPATGVTYAHKIRKEEAVLDWRRSAVELDAQVRAFNSWPIAETVWRGQQLRVWESMPQLTRSDAAPGTVIECAATGIAVATGDGVLRLSKIQLAGRKAMSAAEFLNAHTMQGDFLGNAMSAMP